MVIVLPHLNSTLLSKRLSQRGAQGSRNKEVQDISNLKILIFGYRETNNVRAIHRSILEVKHLVVDSGARSLI